MQMENIDNIICEYCEKNCCIDTIYDLSYKKEKTYLICIDCIYEIYYYL